jgi:phosphatidylethanolamine N-methyltransferase
MDTELRNRKAAGDDQQDSSASTGLSSANKHHHHQPSSSTTLSPDPALTSGFGVDHEKNGSGHSRVPSDDLTRFPLGRRLTETQKESLVKESAETAYGKTPNGTSKFSICWQLFIFFCFPLSPICWVVGSYW